MKPTAARSLADNQPAARRSSSSGAVGLIVLLAAVAAVLCYRACETRVERELRVGVLKRLAETFPNARVKIERVSIQSANKIIVHGLRAAAKDGERLRQVLSVERIEISGDLDIAHIIQERVAIHRIDLYRAQADLWKLGDGTWSLMALNAKCRPGQATPRIELHQSDLRVHRADRDTESPLVLHDINGSCGDGRLIQPIDDIDFLSGPMATAAGLPTGSQPSASSSRTPIAASPTSTLIQPPPARLLEGKLTARSSGTLETLQLEGSLNRANGRVELSGLMSQLEFSSKLIDKLPPDLANLLAQVTGLSCQASARMRIQRDDATSPWKFQVAGTLSNGHLNYERLPYPLDQLSGKFLCDNQSLQLREVKARSGQTNCELDALIRGFHPQAPVQLQVTARQLQLDSRLYAALPQKWQTYWDRVRPSGTVDAQLTLKFDGTNWLPNINVYCKDVELECWLFAYPLSQVEGLINIQRDRLMGRELRGKAGGERIHGNLTFQRIQEEWYGDLAIKCDGPVTIDEKVISALTVRGQPTSAVERFVRSLEPSGTFTVEKAVFRRSYGEPNYWHKDLAITLADSAILYQGFRYPLHRIRGRIEAQDDQWRLVGFEGWNDSGRIQCNGGWQEVRNANIPFNLGFTAYGLPMEDELQRALPDDARQIWDQLQPSGSIDRADVQIVRQAGQSQVGIEVTLHEDVHNGTTGQSLRLHPKSFPSWLSDVACDLKYTPGNLVISQASARNSNCDVKIRAACQKNSAGNWAGTVHWSPGSRVMVDSQLLRALPDSLSQGLAKLDMRGPVNFSGETQFELPMDGVTAPTTDVKMQLELEEVQLGDGKTIDGIRGSVQLVGRRSPTQLVARGWLEIAALSLRGIPVTDIRGPFALSGNQLHFGSEVANRFAAGPNPPTAITASALAGTLAASGSGQLDTGRFQLDARLIDADFRCMLQDLGAASAPTDANCSMELALAGVPWEPQTYSGSGALHLKDAQLYQLPTMIRVLRALSVTPTDQAAFNTADVTFSIDGDRIPLELKCDGDLLSLRGTGYTNFRKELNLELYSYVGGRVPVSSILTPLISESRYQSFMYIPVTGTIDNPQFGKRTIPQLAMFQQIFPDKIDTTNETRTSGRILDSLRR